MCGWAGTSRGVTPAEIVGLLAEPDRLRVLAALVLGARSPSDVASATGLGEYWRSGGWMDVLDG